MSEPALTKDSELWVPDSDSSECELCKVNFSFSNRRHHCRRCGKVFCGECCMAISQLTGFYEPERVCENCIVKEMERRIIISDPDEIMGSENSGFTVSERTGSHIFERKKFSAKRDGFRASSDASVVLKHCNIKAGGVGFTKNGSGSVALSNCVIRANKGIELLGTSLKVTIIDCVIIASSSYGLTVKGTCDLDIKNTLIIARKGTALQIGGSATVTLDFCEVHGMNGLIGRGNTAITISGGCFSCQGDSIFSKNSALHLTGAQAKAHLQQGTVVTGRTVAKDGAAVTCDEESEEEEESVDAEVGQEGEEKEEKEDVSKGEGKWDAEGKERTETEEEKEGATL